MAQELPPIALETQKHDPLLMNVCDWVWHKRLIEAQNKQEFQHGLRQPTRFPCRVETKILDREIEVPGKGHIRICQHKFYYWTTSKCECCGSVKSYWSCPLFD
mgnify:CR=1 FL=1